MKVHFYQFGSWAALAFDGIGKWPRTRYERFPFGIRPSLDVKTWGWFVTWDDMAGATLTEEHALAAHEPGNFGHMWVLHQLATGENERQCWRPDGTEIVEGV